MKIQFSKEVKTALETGKPILALESTLIAHGMPYPDNQEFAQNIDEFCLKHNVVPAVIAILNGKIRAGLSAEELAFIAQHESVKKVSRRELGIAVSKKWNGATTVSSTLHIASQVGIRVFATGGIGGVHRGVEYSFDISQDLIALANIPMIVISAGAKAVLDIPKTLEMMETMGISVLGYQTMIFPAFYSRESGAGKICSVNSPNEVVEIYNNSVAAGLKSSVFVANPIPEQSEIPNNEIESIITTACSDARNKKISGKETTPFLLKQIVKNTGGRSLEANKALALNNVRLGVKIVHQFS